MCLAVLILLAPHQPLSTAHLAHIPHAHVHCLQDTICKLSTEFYNRVYDDTTSFRLGLV